MLSPIKSINYNRHSNTIYFRANNNFKSNPAMNQAVTIARVLEKNGYKKTEEDYYNFLNSEIEELKAAKKNNNYENMKEEAGDVIFNAIMLADHYGISPVEALLATNRKLSSRITIAQYIAEKPLIEYPLDERLKFWSKAKLSLRQNES